MSPFSKLSKQLDFLAIGDTVIDAFIHLSQAEILDSLDHTEKELCITFGDKVPYDFVKVIPGVGNSANAAVSAARLGLSAGFASNIGSDDYGKDILKALKGNGVDTKQVAINKGMESNYHYVLWYDVERTILVKHQKYPYHFEAPAKAPKWIYLSSLGESSLAYHGEIASWLADHPEVKLVFQPGTFQMKFGVEALKNIYSRTDIFFCNVEEAKRILKWQEGAGANSQTVGGASSQTASATSQAAGGPGGGVSSTQQTAGTRADEVKKLMKAMSGLGPKMVFITDGIDGAYAFDGTDNWFMPVYPHKPYERTGAGDAFSSAVTVALALGKSIPEALSWGPIDSMSVVQYVGAQEGLLSREKLLDFLAKAPADYKPRKI
jgi:sugar/nucleoside kinase (ribokinase family)